MEKLKLNTPLTIDEIDFRVQSITAYGNVTILAYKDARADMNRLDAVYGVEGWQRKHEVINGSLFCSVGILHPITKEWVWKEDVGTESNTEKEKGQASDAFKRACFNFGIGRELYDYPIIRLKLNPSANPDKPKQGEFYVEAGKGKQGYALMLKEWKWISKFDANGKLIRLACADEKGVKRFDWKLEKTEV